MPRNSVLMIFIDGVGLGPEGVHNPLAETALPAFEQLAGGLSWTQSTPPLQAEQHLFHPIDATLGVEGLPQSGTGQASLFTGVNCAKIVGRHFGPFPHSETKPSIEAENVFRKVRALGLRKAEPAAFANAYPPRFFEHAAAKGRWTVTTLCCRTAGVRLRTEDDLQERRALTADLTGDAWRAHLGRDAPDINETDAGMRLASISQHHAFTLFEYYLTDKAGHGRLADRSAANVLVALDRFFAGVLQVLDPQQHTLIITSDHGNLEDVTTKTHTRHPVPLVAYGCGAPAFREVDSLAGVTPAIVHTLSASRDETLGI